MWYLTAAEIFQELKSHIGSSLKLSNLITFGRKLSQMPSIHRKAFPDLTTRNFSFRIADLGAQSGDVVVLSGSLPKCCGSDFYARATRELRALGATVVLDASGAPLREAVVNADAASVPHVIKPNAEECEPLVGFVPKTPAEFRRQWRRWRWRSFRRWWRRSLDRKSVV